MCWSCCLFCLLPFVAWLIPDPSIYFGGSLGLLILALDLLARFCCCFCLFSCWFAGLSCGFFWNPDPCSCWICWSPFPDLLGLVCWFLFGSSELILVLLGGFAGLFWFHCVDLFSWLGVQGGHSFEPIHWLFAVGDFSALSLTFTRTLVSCSSCLPRHL